MGIRPSKAQTFTAKGMIMDEQSKSVLKQYTLDAVSILERSLELCKTGHPSFYRVAAVQMRILLCDTTFRHDHQEDIAILPILFPELMLHRLDANYRPRMDEPKIDLLTWLNSIADPKSNLTLRQIIRRVCDVDGGAHVDLKSQAGISDQETARLWIIAIGEYLVPLLDEVLQA